MLSLLVLGQHAILRQKHGIQHRVISCVCHFILVTLWYGRSRDYHVTTKISWLDRLPNFLSNGAPPTRYRAGSANNDRCHSQIILHIYHGEQFHTVSGSVCGLTQFSYSFNPIQTGGGGRFCPHGLWTFITFLISKLKPANLVTFPKIYLGTIWCSKSFPIKFDVTMATTF